MLIKELVKLDEQGKFISAVQLSDYDNPLNNLTLVKSYIFANNAPDMQHGQSRAVGSIDLLDEVRLAYVNSSPTNRFVIIANYGHGKSHLALVLANYFAKPYQSDETQKVLERIDYALQHNKPKAENFHDFKRQYDRFLVIRLRGDTPRTLREQFFPALKSAMQEHPATKNAELPFWNQQAKQWLESKVDDQQSRQFLKDQLGTDFPNLLQDVEDNKQEAYEQYVLLFAHLNNGVSPNAEGNFSLREAVIWAVDTFCKNAKPLAGVVVLFDEFSQFIERYGQSKAIGDLQDMLQGIGDRRGQAMFLAFAQHDPDEVAERVQGGQSLQNIKRELGRIDRKYALYSLMESVLNAYLAQSEPDWERFLQDNPRVKGGLYGQTTEVVWELYLKRYDKELRWTNDKFREVVTKGCFPLHPLTTALLCHLKMQQGIDDDARTILRFVRNRFEFKQNEPVMVEGKINWILPIELADYFGPRIAKQQDYFAYENAIQNLEQVLGDAVTQVHYDILKALLLQVADGLTNITEKRQLELLSQLSGHNDELTKQKLKELSQNNIIKFDPNIKYSSFWPVAANPKALEDKIREKINDKKFGEDELFTLNSKVKTLISGADHIEVNINWGTPTDWAANTAILTKEEFTPSHLQKLMKFYELSYKGLEEGNRGAAIWLMALDDTDIQYFQQNAQQVLQEAFPSENPPPVLLVLPVLVNKSLVDQFMRYQALEQISKEKDAIKEIGQSTYDTEFERTTKALVKAISSLLGDILFASVPRKPEYLVVPQPYRAGVMAMTVVSVQSVLKRLYELAYPYRPPEFFTDLNANPKKGASPLRDAVKAISKNLIFNRIPTLVLTGMTPVAQRVCKDNLLAKWHLLSTSYYIQEPENVLSLKHTWDYLEEQIKPDEKEVLVSKFIVNLFNAPFGFDYNTATLLLTAWIGKHSKEINLYANNKKVGLGYLETLIEQGSPQDFLNKICVQERLALARRDANKELVQGREVVEKVQKGTPYSQADAENAIVTLKGIVSQEICPDSEKDIFNQAIATLVSALEMARVYDQTAQKLITAISNESKVSQLLGLGNDVQHLIWVDLVSPTQPANTEIQEILDQQLKKAVTLSCSQVEKLNRIESADSERNRLKEQKELLQRKHLLDLVALVSEAETRLDERIKQLKAEADEASKIKQIQAMTSGADLARLYAYLEALQAMADGSVGFTKQKNQKQAEIQNAISQLDAFATNVAASVAEIDREQVNSLYEQLLSKDSRYAGTKYEVPLTQARQSLFQLRSFYNELLPIENHVRSLRTPEDVQDIQTEIEKISSKYNEQIGQNHKTLIETIQQDVETRVKEQYSRTEQRINDLAREIGSPSTTLKDARTKLNQISGFVTPQLNARIELLRARIDEREAEYRNAQVEKEAQEKAARLKRDEEQSRLKRINEMKSRAGLATLYKDVEDLQAMDDSSPVIAKARDQKLSEIQREISNLESFVATIAKNVAETNQEQVRLLYNEISNKAWRFDGTEHEDKLNEAKQYLDELRNFYGELREIENLPIRTAEDVHNIQVAIGQITAKYGNVIGKTHKTNLKKAQQDIEYREQEAYAQTEKWICALELELSTASLNELKTKISRVPAYVTPELTTKIEALQLRLSEREAQYETAKREKETQDVIEQIENLFLSISDNKKRQECLDRLQKLP